MGDQIPMLDPRFLVSEFAEGEEEWSFNLPEFRGESEVELYRFDNDGSMIPTGTLSAEDFIAELDEACRLFGPRLSLYFYQAPLDGEFLHAFPHAQDLHIATDALSSPEAIGRMPQLERLIYNAAYCEDRDILTAFRLERLSHFTIVETPARKLDLAPLAAAKKLDRLRIMGQYGNVEAVGELTQLRELVFYPSRRLDLGFLEALTSLEVLKFAIGAMESLASLRKLPALRDLSFEWVRYLEDLGDLQRFPTLERLRMNDQKRVGKIATGAGNRRLRHIRLGGMAALEKIEGLEDLPRLESLMAHSTGLTLDALALPDSLTHLLIVPKKMRERAALVEAIEARGLIAEQHPDSNFFYK